MLMIRREGSERTFSGTKSVIFFKNSVHSLIRIWNTELVFVANMQCNAVQCSAVQCNAVQCSGIECSKRIFPLKIEDSGSKSNTVLKLKRVALSRN